MCEERLLLIRRLHDRLDSVVNDWLREHCEGIRMQANDYSDFHFFFVNGEPDFQGLTNSQVHDLFEFVQQRICIHGVGCLITPHEFYFGVSHLNLNMLRNLANPLFGER